MVYAVRKKAKVVSESCTFKGRSYRNYNTEQFTLNLSHQNWDNYRVLTNPNEIWSMFYNNILLSIKYMCPLKSYNVNKVKEIWVMNETLEMIN